VEIDSLPPPDTEDDEIRREMAVQTIKTKYQNFRAGLLRTQLSKALLVKVKEAQPSSNSRESTPLHQIQQEKVDPPARAASPTPGAASAQNPATNTNQKLQSDYLNVLQQINKKIKS